jgi:hypothetical protein
MPVLLSAALATAIAYAVYAVIYNVYFHPLAKFPGPPIARTTIYWKAYVECIANRSFSHVLVELHARYGETAGTVFSTPTRADIYCATKATLFVSDPMRYANPAILSHRCGIVLTVLM